MTRTGHRVRWASCAIRDLHRIVDTVAEDNQSAARKLATRLEKRAESLCTSPARGRIVPELRALSIDSYRELIIKPYRLMYRIVAQEVVVLGLFDGRRDVDSVLLLRLAHAP